MSANPTSAIQTRFPARPMFVLVNDRVPRTDTSCVRCSAKIAGGYVRQPQTRLLFCNLACFAGRGKMAISGIVNRARRAS
jgi:hypothetical protein